MKKILLLLMMLYSCRPAFAENILLKKVDNRELVYIVNNFEILAEQTHPPMRVRIISVKEHGECEPGLTNCPKQSVYIAVSTFDENPIQQLFYLSKAYEWRFKQWISIPSNDGANDFVIFEIIKKDVHKEHDVPTIIERKYRLSVNLNKAFINGDQ
jgi:hypothetical protein